MKRTLDTIDGICFCILFIFVAVVLVATDKRIDHASERLDAIEKSLDVHEAQFDAILEELDIRHVMEQGK